jgi:hypothetical protein
MNQEKLQAEIRDDFEKLSNKYDKKGTGVYAFFVCYMNGEEFTGRSIYCVLH